MHLRRAQAGTAHRHRGRRALGGGGRGAVVADLTLVARAPGPGGPRRAVAREALIRGAGLVAGPVEALADSHVGSIRSSPGGRAPWCFVGATTWDPLLVEQPAPLRRDAGPRRARAAHLLRSRTSSGPERTSTRPLAAHLSLGPAQVQRAVPPRLAAFPDPADPRPATYGSASGRRTPPAWSAWPAGSRRVTWGRPGPGPVVRRALGSSPPARTVTRCSWTGGCDGAGPRPRRCRRCSPATPGQGETMSAGVIAADLGLDLYATVNLATVGRQNLSGRPRRTWAHLRRARRRQHRAVLRRGRRDLRQAQRYVTPDRYANIRRLPPPAAPGPSTVSRSSPPTCGPTSTRRSRRLDTIVDFPAPDPRPPRGACGDGASTRRSPWRRTSATFCARSFELAGGNIRSAADGGVPGSPGARRSMAHVIAAVAGVPQSSAAGPGRVRPLPPAADGLTDWRARARALPFGHPRVHGRGHTPPRQIAMAGRCREHTRLGRSRACASTSSTRRKPSAQGVPAGRPGHRAAGTRTAEGRPTSWGMLGSRTSSEAAGGRARLVAGRRGPSPVHGVIQLGRTPREWTSRADMEGRLGRLRRRAGATRPAGRSRPGGERARLHGRLRRRLPARPHDPGPTPAARCWHGTTHVVQRS